MAEYEELKIGVRLTGDAQAQLEKYKSTMKEAATGETSRHMEKGTKQLGYLQQGLKAVGLEASGTAAQLVRLAGGLGATVGGVAALGAAYALAAKKIADMAIAMNQVSRSAEEIGTTLAQKMNFRDQLGRMGRSAQEADQILTDTIRVAAENRTKVFDQLAIRLKQGGSKFREDFQRDLYGARTEVEQFNVIQKYYERAGQLGREQHKNESEAQQREAAAEKQRIFREETGFSLDLAQTRELHEMDAERVKFWEKMDENSKNVAANANSAKENIHAIVAELQSRWFDPDKSPFPATLKNINDLTADLLKLLTESDPSKMKEHWSSFWKDLLPEVTIDRGSPMDWLLRHFRHTLPGAPHIPIPYTGEKGGDLAKQLGIDAIPELKDQKEKTDENTRQLKQLNDNLYQLLSPGGGATFTGEGGRASGESYDTSTGTPRAPGSYTPATPETPATPPAPANVPKAPVPATIETMPSPGSVAPPGSPFDPFMPKTPNTLTTAPPSNPGGAFESGIPTYAKGYLSGIAQTESSWSESQAYSDSLNKVANNATVRQIGYKMGADFGYFQMNRRDADFAVRNLGMTAEQASHLYGKGPETLGGAREGASTKEQQMDAVNEYSKRRWPDDYKKLVETGDWKAFRKAHGNQWFGPWRKNAPAEIQKEMKKATDEARVAGASVLGGTEGPAEAAARQRIDGDATARQRQTEPATGNVRVEVPAPGGGRPLSDSLFSKTPMTRPTQMQPASSGAHDEPARPGALQGWN